MPSVRIRSEFSQKVSFHAEYSRIVHLRLDLGLILNKKEHGDKVLAAKNNPVLFLLLIAAAVQLSCSKMGLDRETAARLLRGRPVEIMQRSFSALPSHAEFRGHWGMTSVYRELANAGLLTCNSSETVCEPGPNSEGLHKVGTTEIGFVAGHLVAVDVTGVTQSGTDSALADVQIAFQPTPLYLRHQYLLDRVGDESSLHGSLLERTHWRVARASFQRYADGWRLDTIQQEPDAKD